MLIYYHRALLTLPKFCFQKYFESALVIAQENGNSYMKVLQVLKVSVFDLSYFVVLQVQERSIGRKVFWHCVQT